MSGARLDTLRIELGLSIGELAQLAGCREKSVNRWIRGENPVPSALFERLTALRETMLRQVDFAVDQVTDAVADGPLPVVRWRTRAAYEASEDKHGLPMGAHAMLCAWTARALAAEGVACDFVFADDMPRAEGRDEGEWWEA